MNPESLPRTETGAIFSPGRQWRYLLWRIWEPEGKNIAFIGLNPSTANEEKNDPTVSRCIRMARDWGFPGMFMLNAFAYRATDPREMKDALCGLFSCGPPGDGVLNDTWIKRIATESARVVVCWGNHGLWRGRQEHILSLLQGVEVWCLGMNKNGTPKHPLYLPRDVGLKLYKEADNAGVGGPI